MMMNSNRVLRRARSSSARWRVRPFCRGTGLRQPKLFSRGDMSPDALVQSVSAEVLDNIKADPALAQWGLQQAAASDRRQGRPLRRFRADDRGFRSGPAGAERRPEQRQGADCGSSAPMWSARTAVALSPRDRPIR